MASNSEDLHSAALAYHRLPRPGKLEIQAIKPLANQRDLALAYSPGVAIACEEIVRDPAEAVHLTSRANLARRTSHPAPLFSFMRVILLGLSCIGGAPPRFLYLHTL